jgi:hypothetical protein
LGDPAEAERNSKKAKTWNIVALVGGICTYIVVIILTILLVAFGILAATHAAIEISKELKNLNLNGTNVTLHEFLNNNKRP